MITIVEPKQQINKLLGPQRIDENECYRMMRYVLRLDHDGKVLLHNVISGRLVVLSQEEIRLLDQLPAQYNATMNQLIDSYFLVPESFDEHQKVVGMRKVMRTIHDKYQESGITHYTILPTTACNARCFYCYEQGLKTVTMSEETADDVVKFIVSQSEGKKISIRWFGGEPTIAIPRIDQICKGLRAHSLEFSSIMTTNGYLLSEELIKRIKEDWNLQQVMISMDGCETNYNRIKSYVNPGENPYRKVLRNIGLLLGQEIFVNLRMNFDYNNYADFNNWLDEIETLYKGNRYLNIRVHQINPHYPDADCESFWAHKQWYNDKMAEMEDTLREKGYPVDGFLLPCLKYHLCSASNNRSIVINPDGSLVKCPDSLEPEHVIGNVKQGVTDVGKVLSWRQEADYEKCQACLLFPECVSIINCKSSKECLFLPKKIYDYHNSMVAKYNLYIDKNSSSSNGLGSIDDSRSCQHEE